MKIAVSLAASSLVYLPLDERFATRGCFLRMAQIASSVVNVSTLPNELLPSLKAPPNQGSLNFEMLVHGVQIV